MSFSLYHLWSYSLVKADPTRSFLQVETSRLLHRKFVGKSKPNSDPYTFLTCAKAIQLGYAAVYEAAPSTTASTNSSLPSTSNSTPASHHPPLPSPGLQQSHSYLQHPSPSIYSPTPMIHSASTISLPSSLSSSSSLYTSSPASSHAQFRLPPTGPSRADSFPSGGQPIGYPHLGTSSVPSEPSRLGRGTGSLGSIGSKRRRTNPEAGMISLGMIGLGIDSREERERGQSADGEFGVAIRPDGRRV